MKEVFLNTILGLLMGLGFVLIVYFIAVLRGQA